VKFVIKIKRQEVNFVFDPISVDMQETRQTFSLDRVRTKHGKGWTLGRAFSLKFLGQRLDERSLAGTERSLDGDDVTVAKRRRDALSNAAPPFDT
jgi:hypothetical protein